VARAAAIHLDSLVTQLARSIKRGEVVFFAGAGISNEPPSSLPLAADLTRHIVNIIFAGSRAQTWHRTLQRAISRIRPEVFFQRILDTVGPRGLEGLRILQASAFNRNHRFVATAASKSHLCMTTNFDDLIELACKSQGLIPHVLANPRECARFRHGAFSQRGMVHVLKLHGTLSTKGKGPPAAGLTTTLNQVARGLHPNVAHLFGWILRRKTLVVVGYSGLDELDIVPVLRGVKSRHSIVWVDHRPTRTIRVRLPKPTNTADRIDKILLTRPNGSGIRCIGSTSIFLAKLATELNYDLGPILSVTNSSPVSDPPCTFSDLERLRLAGAVFTHLNDYLLAGKAYRELLRRRAGDPKARREHMEALFGLGAVAMWRGRGAAEALYRRALSIARCLRDWQTAARIKRNLGILYTRRGSFPRALRSFLEGASLSRRVTDSVGEADLRANAGWVRHRMGDFSEALADLRYALRRARRHGVLRLTAQILNDIGAVYYVMGRLPEALASYEKSLELKETIGDRYTVLQTLNNIAIVHKDQGQLPLALSILKQVAMEFEQLGESHMAAIAYGELGDVLFLSNRMRLALACQRRSVAGCRAAPDAYSQGVALLRLGKIYKSRRSWPAAVRCMRLSVEKLRGVGAELELALSSEELGRLFLERGRREEAVVYLRSTVRRYRQLGRLDQAKEVEVLL